MPEPGQDETRDEFIERCIPMVIEDGTAEDGEQGYAVCLSFWEEAHKGGKMAEKEYTTAVKVISQDADTITLGGYGIVFGGRDLEGETFTKETDFMLDLVPRKLVMYSHGLYDVKSPLGWVDNARIKMQDVGMWIEAQLQLSKEYVREIIKLAEMGVLGWSSGSVPHLANVEKGIIKQWPIVEFSLTPTPAEPRTLGVEVLKELVKLHPELEALLPEAPGNGAADATDGGVSVLQLRARACLASFGED